MLSFHRQLIKSHWNYSKTTITKRAETPLFQEFIWISLKNYDSFERQRRFRVLPSDKALMEREI